MSALLRVAFAVSLSAAAAARPFPLAVRWRAGSVGGKNDEGIMREEEDDVVEWQKLRSFARDASLSYFDAAVIIAAHERGRYTGQSPSDVNLEASNASAVAVWHRTKHGDAALIVRELPACGMRYFVRTERQNGRYLQRVVIKGSDNVQNFRDDVDYAKVGCADCHVRFHRGFLRVASAIWDDVEALLRRDASIELTGHSLGGGAATILAMKLAALGYDVSHVITFGSPKVTNAHGCRLFATRVPLLRVLTADDPVPMLPSWDTMTQNFGFYRHFGRRVVLLEDDDEDEEDEEEQESTRGAARDVDVTEVELCPIDGSGEARRKKSVIGKGRYAARPDARVARFLNANAALPTWRSVRAMARDFAMHQLDESFLLHAHHVSPFAHSMDAYETQIATREIRSTSMLPHLCRRRERPVAALKRRVPFIGLTAVAGRYVWKWRKLLGVARPKYLLMSLLFVGWTGGWHALANKQQQQTPRFSAEEQEPTSPFE